MLKQIAALSGAIDADVQVGGFDTVQVEATSVGRTASYVHAGLQGKDVPHAGSLPARERLAADIRGACACYLDDGKRGVLRRAGGISPGGLSNSQRQGADGNTSFHCKYFSLTYEIDIWL